MYAPGPRRASPNCPSGDAGLRWRWATPTCHAGRAPVLTSVAPTALDALAAPSSTSWSVAVPRHAPTSSGVAVPRRSPCLGRPFPAPWALGRCLGHTPFSTRSAPGSTRRPHSTASSSGARPTKPCPLACCRPLHCSHCLYLSPYTHLPLSLPLSLTSPGHTAPGAAPTPTPAPPWTRREGGREGGRDSLPDTSAGWPAISYEMHAPGP